MPVDLAGESAATAGIRGKAAGVGDGVEGVMPVDNGGAAAATTGIGDKGEAATDCRESLPWPGRSVTAPR